MNRFDFTFETATGKNRSYLIARFKLPNFSNGRAICITDAVALSQNVFRVGDSDDFLKMAKILFGIGNVVCGGKA